MSTSQQIKWIQFEDEQLDQQHQTLIKGGDGNDSDGDSNIVIDDTLII